MEGTARFLPESAGRHDQIRAGSRQLNVPDMLDRRLLPEEPKKVETFTGEITAANVELVDADGIHLLDSINFQFPLGIDVAIVGHSNSG